jgi:hypothetical protein
MPPAAKVTLPQVPAAQAPVAPGQVSPTTQSEATPRPEARTPGINPQSLTWLDNNRPEDGKLVREIAEKYGISPERLAAHWWSESRLQRNSRDGTSGEQGIMQVMPGTRKGLDPSGSLDPYNYKHSLELGARYIRDLDHEFGKDKFSSVVAYNGGPGTANKVARGEPTNGNAVKYASHPVFFGGETFGPHDITGSIRINGDKVVEAAEKAGPSGVLSYLSQTEPNNMPLSDKWYAVKRAMVSRALAKGGPHAIDEARAADQWVFEQSRQGANENLISAYRAMQGGDGKGAAQYLAKAHAFFPDGSIGQFGVDEKGQVWTQRLDEHDPARKLGAPTMVTKEAVASLLITSRDPNKHLKLLEEQEKHVAGLRHQSKQEEYWKDSTNNKQEMTDLRRQQGEERLQNQREAIEQRRLAAENANLLQQQKLFDAQQKQEADRAARKQAVDTEIATEYGTKTDGTVATNAHPNGTAFSQDDTARASQVYRDIRTQPEHTAAPEAKRVANGVASGQFVLQPATAKDGTPIYIVHDPKTGKRQAVVTKATGDQLIAGGLNPPAPPREPTKAPVRQALPAPPPVAPQLHPGAISTPGLGGGWGAPGAIY